MGKKHYSQSIKDEAVLFYELGHSFAETQAKYGMAESTFFTWKQKFDKAHPMHEAITTNRATSHKSKRHLEKLALELEVLRQCPCGSKASIAEKVAAVNALCGRYHHLYGTPQELQAVLDEYINFYNSQRPHRKLNMKTPNQYESAFYSGCL